MLYEAELEQSTDEDEAAGRALLRFGNPAEIRAQLKELVPFSEGARLTHKDSGLEPDRNLG